MVAERARHFAEKAGVALDDPFSVTRLDAAEADQPGRLVEEARTVPMFAARRLLWVRNVGIQKAIADDVKALCAEPPKDAVVLIEAGELKKGAPLRTVVEASPAAMALPCYADEARALDQLIDDVLGAESIRIGLEARAELKRNLGGDRMASRGELTKLALFARGRDEVTVQDVRQLIGDVSGASMDDAVDAALMGRMDQMDHALQRYAQSGAQNFLLISAMTRQLQALQLLRDAFDAGGRSASEIIASARPPVFFARKKLMEAALQRFSATFLTRALEKMAATLLQTRRRPDLAIALTRQALLEVAVESARLGQRGR